MKCGTIIILSPICPKRKKQKNRWGKLVEAYLTLVRHVSMRPVTIALRLRPAKPNPRIESKEWGTGDRRLETR
jgi:hypothetical protein